MQQEKVIFEEEKDFNQPTLIDTSHMAGDITRVRENYECYTCIHMYIHDMCIVHYIIMHF